jgi:hypothetical protein
LFVDPVTIPVLQPYRTADNIICVILLLVFSFSHAQYPEVWKQAFFELGLRLNTSERNFDFYRLLFCEANPPIDLYLTRTVGHKYEARWKNGTAK